MNRMDLVSVGRRCAPFALDALDPHQKRFWRFAIFSIDSAVLERTMARATIAYLEQRYEVLEKEIADALRDSPTDDRAIADLKYRKRIIANEILDNRRLVERFRKRVAH